MIIDAFYSDPHFGHGNIISYCDRPFESVSHMDASLIENYNAVVGENDIVLWLGDCFFYGFEDSRDILNKLNGKKLLVRGNHDKSISRMLRIGFDAVMQEFHFMHQGDLFRCSHYPWGKGRMTCEKKGEKYLLHGHTHSKERFHKNMIHVGIDAWDYKPVKFEDVINVAKS